MKPLFFGLNTALLLAIAVVYFVLDSKNYQTEAAYAVQFCRAEALLVAPQYGLGPDHVLCSFDPDYGWARGKIHLFALESDAGKTVTLICDKKFGFFRFYEMENCEFKAR